MRSGRGVPDTDAAAARRWSWDVLAHRNLRWYLAGNVCSNLGTWLQNTAQVLLAYGLTDSVLGVGLVTGAQFAGALILAPVAGMVADRFDRRRILIWTHVFSAAVAVAMAGLQHAGALTLSPLVFGALAIGLAYTFTLPALSAFIPTLVPPDRTRAAMALNAVSFNVGRALAPVLCLGVIASVGYTWAFLLNAASFIVLAGVFWRLRPRSARAKGGATAGLLDGLRIAWHDRRVLVGLVLVSLVTVATDPPVVLGPSLARDVFGVDATWSAYFLAAFGLGTLVGSLLPTGRATLRGIANYLGVLGGAIIFLAVGPVGFWWAAVAVAVAGAASLLAGAAAQTLLLSCAGPARAGSVMAVWALAFAGSRPVATAIDTWLAGWLSPRFAAVALAAPAVAVGLAVRHTRLTKFCQMWSRRFSVTGLRPAQAVAVTK